MSFPLQLARGKANTRIAKDRKYEVKRFRAQLLRSHYVPIDTKSNNLTNAHFLKGGGGGEPIAFFFPLQDRNTSK